MAVTSVEERRKQRQISEAFMQVEAKGERVKKELDHIRVHRAKNGGHVVEHHHKHFAHPPETHVFGPHERGKLLAHLGKHLGVPASEEEAEETEHNG